MKTYFYIFIVYFLLIDRLFASELITTGINTGYELIEHTDIGLVGILAYIQDFLLKGLVPLVVVGSALYIAYELFTADGNEEKMKKAWKTLSFTAFGLLMITLSYAIISVVSRLSF